MNRKIKFRGKRIYNNEWIYGSLIDNKFIFDKDYDNYDIYYDEEYGIIDGRLLEVDSKTIGQYTGLKDKNGVEIYEGDIIEYKDSIGKHVKKVEFDKGCFYAGLHGGSSTRVSPKLINTRISKVIGNIYENEAEEVK